MSALVAQRTTVTHLRTLLLGGLLFGLNSGSPSTLSVASADGTAAAPAGASDGEIRFQFVELKDKGVVRCALYAAPEDYMKKSFRNVVGAVSGSRAVCVFSHISPGTYSMAAFHDENNNDKLDTGIFGIPKEGVSTSNNAKGHMGPPKYKDAAFVFSGGSMTQELKMKYW
jgi:uncharacterized protein (DUF2141 family)